MLEPDARVSGAALIDVAFDAWARRRLADVGRREGRETAIAIESRRVSEFHARAIRDDEPLKSWPADKPIPIRIVPPGDPTAGPVPQSLANWGYFEGASLSVGLQSSPEEGLRFVGSAVMIAPGLAVTATHVFMDFWEGLEANEERMALQGIRSDGTADMWNVRHITRAEGDDMALLGIELMSKIHANWYISTFPLTTRTPFAGEPILIAGFREEKESRHVDPGDVSTQTNVGDMYVARGEVGEIYEDRRDQALPFPAFEVQCGSHGGMSGGAVLDDAGKLLGVITRGWEISDGKGPTYATRITELLKRPIRLAWPPGVYPERVAPADIAPELLHLEGRDKLTETDGQLGYEVWTHRDEADE